MKTLISAALLLTALLAGCSGDAGESHLVVDFAGTRANVEAHVPLASAPWPTADRYAADGADHPGFFTVFDQIAAWSEESGVPVEASYSPDFGYFLSSIAGLPEPGASAYWSLEVNGAVSEVGMGLVELAAGDAVAWTLTSFEPMPGEAPASASVSTSGGETDGVALTVQVPQPTSGESVTLTGTVDRPTSLEFTVLAVAPGGRPPHDPDAYVQADVEGDWNVEVPLKRIGQSQVLVSPADAAGSAQVSVTAVRLGTYTFEVLYGGYPGQADSTDAVLMDPDAFLSAPAYAEQGAQHPGFPIIHDLMAAWETATGNTVEYAWSDSFGAYSVNRINGAGNPVTASLPPWWCYKVNGERVELGISLQPIAPGDVVSWDLGACP